MHPRNACLIMTREIERATSFSCQGNSCSTIVVIHDVSMMNPRWLSAIDCILNVVLMYSSSLTLFHSLAQFLPSPAVPKARECLAELIAVQQLLASSHNNELGDGKHPDHARSKDASHACLKHSGNENKRCCAGTPEGVLAGSQPQHAGSQSSHCESSQAQMTKANAGAIGIVRRAKAMCRVAEGACFLRAGRAAQATETLRDLLLEVGGLRP